MALTGMQLYKNLPKTNCKDCGLPTCMAFAMQVASKQRALTDCPHISDDAKNTLAEASSPPMRLVKIGSAGNEFEIGQETVMYRHEEKFHRKCGIAIRIQGNLTESEVKEKITCINKSKFERIGETLKISLCAVELDNCQDPAAVVARIKLILENCDLPLILISNKADNLNSALELTKHKKPLIYVADTNNLDEIGEIAAKYKTPIAITAQSLEELSDLTKKAKSKGAEDIVLAFTSKDPKTTLQNLTMARRAALKKQFRALGYPVLVDISANKMEKEAIFASTFAIKYAGIVIIDNPEPWILLPIMTAIQDIYTDPQVNSSVEAKLYEIGDPDENSPVLFTTNFSLTYFSVAGEVERSKIPAYISVVETEGLGVLNAYAGDKISAEKIIKTIDEQGVKTRVKHNKLIIPGLVPFYRAEIAETSNWKEVIIGPETAREIPAFLAKTWK